VSNPGHHILHINKVVRRPQGELDRLPLEAGPDERRDKVFPLLANPRHGIGAYNADRYSLYSLHGFKYEFRRPLGQRVWRLHRQQYRRRAEKHKRFTVQLVDQDFLDDQRQVLDVRLNNVSGVRVVNQVPVGAQEVEMAAMFQRPQRYLMMRDGRDLVELAGQPASDEAACAGDVIIHICLGLAGS